MIRLLLAAALAAISSLALAQGPAPGGSATGTGYPINSQPITASATGTTGALAATLAGAVGQTTYLCGFLMSSGGTTTGAATQTTITGTVGGSLNLVYVDVSSGQGLLGAAFPICIPATGPNTPITVNMPAGGTGTQAAVFAWGYRL